MFVSNFPPNDAFFTIGMQKNACLTHPHPKTLQEDAAARELRSALLLSEAHVAPHLPQEQRRWSERFRDSGFVGWWVALSLGLSWDIWDAPKMAATITGKIWKDES